MSNGPAEILALQALAVSYQASHAMENLCPKCIAMEVWAQPFRIEDKVLDLEKHSSMCDFCLVRWNICKELDLNMLPEVYFDRFGSSLKVNGMYPPVLSVFQEPGKYVKLQLQLYLNPC